MYFTRTQTPVLLTDEDTLVPDCTKVYDVVFVRAIWLFGFYLDLNAENLPTKLQ